MSIPRAARSPAGVFDALKKAIAATPALNGKTRSVTLSFDPARELMPLVEGFSQDVRVTYERSSGGARRELSHLLKVFLIDRAGDVRELYSSLFLRRQTVLNDIETLLMEESLRSSPAAVTKNTR